LLNYKDGDKNISIFKCKKCFHANPGLTNYRSCEVYSRVVGYLRPVQQWNLAKAKEFKDRKNYKL
jgi:anaerobic ribonucleoside-triphosphate reductase